MIFKSPPTITNKKSFLKYLEIDLFSWLKDISFGMSRLNFKDNFQSFTVKDVIILAGEEVGIGNQFKNRYPGMVPDGRIIVRQKGNAIIEDGDQNWTADNVYLKNSSENNAVVTVLFYKDR